MKISRTIYAGSDPCLLLGFDWQLSVPHLFVCTHTNKLLSSVAPSDGVIGTFTLHSLLVTRIRIYAAVIHCLEHVIARDSKRLEKTTQMNKIHTEFVNFLEFLRGNNTDHLLSLLHQKESHYLIRILLRKYCYK